MKQLYFLLLFVGYSFNYNSQIFLNGSFENNTTDICIFNDISNDEFNAIMSDVKGFGLDEKIDIVYDIDCPLFGDAFDGHYFVSVENNYGDSASSTMLSLKLADTLQIGSTYSFCFYDRGLEPDTDPVVIGISSTDSTFGTIIYYSPIIDTIWNMRTVSFNSPITARYVTIKYSGFHGGAFIDNFGSCEGNGISEDKITKGTFNISPNPSSEKIKIQAKNLENFNYKIYNSYGQLISGNIASNGTTIDVSKLPDGIYYIEFLCNNKTERQQFVVLK